MPYNFPTEWEYEVYYTHQIRLQRWREFHDQLGKIFQGHLAM